MTVSLHYINVYDWIIRAEWWIHTSGNWAIIVTDNGLSPVRHLAIIWTCLLLIGLMGTIFNEIVIIMILTHKKHFCKIAPIFSGFNKLRNKWHSKPYIYIYIYSYKQSFCITNVECHKTLAIPQEVDMQRKELNGYPLCSSIKNMLLWFVIKVDEHVYWFCGIHWTGTHW